MNKQELNEKVFDEMLIFAAEKSADDLASSLPSDEELAKQVTFSPEFEKRMSDFFRNVERKQRNRQIRRTLIKVGIAACIALAVMSSLVMSVEAFRVPFLNLFSRSDDKSVTVKVEDKIANYDAFADQIKGLYLPSYIPDTYSVSEVLNPGNSYIVIFENSDGARIDLTALLSGSSTGIDNENAVIENILINDEEAQYYSSNGVNNLIFKYDQNVFALRAQIPKDEMVKMAESLKYWS
jgi:hypothetical protein